MQTASFQKDTVIPLSMSTSPGALSGYAADVSKPHLSTNEPTASLSLPKLPKDRPFTNLASSSELPPNYAIIFESDANPRDKALRLKAALRRDNIQLIAYFLMLASYMTLTLFQLCGGKLLHYMRNVLMLIDIRMQGPPNTDRGNSTTVLTAGKPGVIWFLQ
jgi:hypothetical protein